ncbi:MAG: SlyX family protein [Gammaproteobacteria bacterium]|nr:SlyX family protein [Gammaproteobacteria bacterium]
MNDIEKLQEQVAFQERTIEQLNDAVADQQRQITKLSDELRMAVKLMQQWRSSGESGQENIDTAHEIPPHY